jgi:hypothetical protein
MSGITLRVMEGADRGRVFDNLPLPVFIGREEGNTVQLNDERVSRCHLKIQEDDGQYVLTDLESTNGTRVNEEDVQLRILRYGDVIRLGRSVLLFGSREEIAQRLAQLRKSGGVEDETVDPEEYGKSSGTSQFTFELGYSDSPDLQAALHHMEPPKLPRKLTASQKAQLSELLEFMHVRLRGLISSVASDPKTNRMTLEMRQWQNLIDLQAHLAEYLRAISEREEV